jgi:hypothetical protein
VAKTLAVTLTDRVQWAFDNAQDLSTPVDAQTVSLGQSFTTGTGANKADRIFADTRSVGDTGETLDLYGVLVDSFGAAINFAKIKALIIRNKSTVTGEYLVIGGAAAPAPFFSEPASDKIILGPGGVMKMTWPVDGIVVTQTTADGLKISAAAGKTISYDIIIIGESA